MNTRAVVFDGAGHWTIERFPMPEAPVGGAVLRVEAVGLCHSDLSQLHGHRHVPGEVSPVVPGHEVVGTIHALAPGADLGVAVGDRVAVDPVRFGPPSVDNPMGLDVYGYTRGLDDEGGLWGGYAEYMTVAAGTHLARFSSKAPAEELTIFEPLSNCLHWLDQCGFEAGQSIVVQGPGHMGLTCAAAARALGARLVVVTGTAVDTHRLSVAALIGADRVVDIDADDPVDAVREATKGRMADLAVDLTNAPGAPGRCLDFLRFGGTALWAGLKDRATAPVISDDVVTRGITIRGGSGGTARSVDAAVAMLDEGRFPTTELLGTVVDLDRLDLAMAVLERTAPTDAVRAVLRHAH